jgi:hypothetical protein
LSGTLWQATGRQGIGILSIYSIFRMDPILLTLGMTGAIFAAIIKRDFFILLWIIPFVIFASVIESVVYFHWVLLLPVFCIAAAILIEDLSKRIIRTKKKVQQLLLFSITSGIGTFGLISTIMLVTNNFFLSQFEAAAFVVQNLQDNTSNGSNITIISGPIYSWIFRYVFNQDHVFSHPRDSSQPITKRIVLMDDTAYRHVISDALAKKEIEDKKQIEMLNKLYNNTNIIASFVDNGVQYNYRLYPYISIIDCLSSNIQVRMNY